MKYTNINDVIVEVVEIEKNKKKSIKPIYVCHILNSNCETQVGNKFKQSENVFKKMWKPLEE